MAPIENYHGDINEDLKIAKKNNNKENFVPKGELELMVDPETLEPYRELFGKDAQNIDEEYNPFRKPVIETEKEYQARSEDIVDTIIDRAIDKEDVDYVGDPDDAAKLEAEHKELMKKYDNAFGKNDPEDHDDFITDLGNESAELKHESMSTETKRKLGRLDDGRGLTVDNQSIDAERLLRNRSNAPMLGRDNLKTMPDQKKQRNFRERIRKFLDLN